MAGWPEAAVGGVGVAGGVAVVVGALAAVREPSGVGWSLQQKRR